MNFKDWTEQRRYVKDLEKELPDCEMGCTPGWIYPDDWWITKSMGSYYAICRNEQYTHDVLSTVEEWLFERSPAGEDYAKDVAEENFNTLVDDRVHDGIKAFWNVLSDEFPDIRNGDLPEDDEMELHNYLKDLCIKFFKANEGR